MFAGTQASARGVAHWVLDPSSMQPLAESKGRVVEQVTGDANWVVLSISKRDEMSSGTDELLPVLTAPVRLTGTPLTYNWSASRNAKEIFPYQQSSCRGCPAAHPWLLISKHVWGKSPVHMVVAPRRMELVTLTLF